MKKANVLLVTLTGIISADNDEYFKKLNESVIEVHVPILPANVEEFLELRNKLSVNAEGGEVMFLLAARIYSKHSKEEVLRCMSAIELSGTLKVEHPA